MDEALAVNRANWDERVAIHVASDFYDVEHWLRDGRGPRAGLADRSTFVCADVLGRARIDDETWSLPADRSRIPLSFTLVAHRP